MEDTNIQKNTTDSVICTFCKNVGHLIKGCTLLNEIVCECCKKTGHTTNSCFYNIDGKNFQFCEYCKKGGHSDNICYKKKKNIKININDNKKIEKIKNNDIENNQTNNVWNIKNNQSNIQDKKVWVNKVINKEKYDGEKYRSDMHDAIGTFWYFLIETKNVDNVSITDTLRKDYKNQIDFLKHIKDIYGEKKWYCDYKNYDLYCVQYEKCVSNFKERDNIKNNDETDTTEYNSTD